MRRPLAMSHNVLELDQIRQHDDGEVEAEEGDLSSCPSDRVRRSLLVISKALEVEDFQKSDEEIFNLTELLDSIYGSASPHDSQEALEEVHRFVSSPSSHQACSHLTTMAVDAIAMVASRTVVKFADVSDRSKEISVSIIKCFISACSPRDMLSAFCEALQSTVETSTSPVHFVLLLRGLSQVLCNLKRRHIQQVKVVLPVVLNVVHVVLLDSGSSYEDSVIALVDAIISVAASIRLISDNLVGRMKQELIAILGLYVLQTMSLMSKSNLVNKISNSISFMTKLSQFLPFCGLSYMGLITGSDLDAAFSVVCNEDSDDFLACFSLLKDGAALAVVWGYIFIQIQEASEEKLSVLLNKLKTSHAERWQVISMLRYVLSSVGYPWVIKDYVIDLMLNMVDKQIPDDSNDENSDVSSMFLSMQAIEGVVIYAPEANLRKKSFAALKKVLSDIPAVHRFDILKALMKNSSSPSMVALLIDLVKEKCVITNPQEVLQSDQSKQVDIKYLSIQPSWFLNALELVEMVLKPPVGGPPSLPENAEPVLSALNLYRFILLTELRGKTNHSGVLSKNNLRRAYAEWLLPLRSVASGIEAELKDDTGKGTSNALCALNPVLLVLYRCIELVEDIQRTSV